MKKQLLHVYLLVCALFLSCLARGQSYTVPITGPATACIGNTTSYTIPGTSGINYYWSVTAGGTAATSSPANATSFLWTVAGTCTITVVGQDSGGHHTDSGLKVVTVYPIPQPTITANTRVACQSLDSLNVDSSSTANNVLNDADGCVKVCEGSYVIYTAHGPAGSTFAWSVSGGTIIGSSTSSTVTVRWGAPGGGSITLTDIGPGGCTGTTTVCIDIILKPHAAFSIQPNTAPAASYTACLDATLVFHDLSTASTSSPIISWLWFFGDGTSSSTQNPTHLYGSAGVRIVSLIVTNACGCTDTFKTTVTILNAKGPDIQCPAVVCQGEKATYRTSAVCGTFNWSVTGGVITSGAGTNTIVVTWGAGSADGFGYVNLAVSGCALCPGASSIRVPIIQSNPVITGPPNPICANKPYQYGLPLWPGTQYEWGVISNPACVIDGRNSNIATLQFPVAGTYTVHAWYQNRLTLCGGDRKFTVVVVNPPTITGSLNACAGAGTNNYSLSTGVSGSWVLSGPSGYTQTGTGTIFAAVFPTAGSYRLSVTGSSFCPPDPITITVQPAPPPPTSLTGPTQVCLGQPYTYAAAIPATGYNFHWYITGGTLSSTTGNSVTVVWNAPGVISVAREGNVIPYCSSSTIALGVSPFPLNPDVTGPTSVCANTYVNYTDNYTIADATTWQIIPNTAGSVVTGNYSPNMTVLWNNTLSGQFADIVVTIHKCDSVRTDTLHVYVNPSPIVTLTPVTSTVCNGGAVSFTATPGAGSYAWNFGDGSTTVTSSNTISHNFSTSVLGTAVIPYTVSVIATGTAGGSGCPPFGTASVTVNVIPGPYASISTPDPTLWCTSGPAILDNLSAVVTNSTGTVTYQWYLNGVAIPGATNATYTATTDGAYTFSATDGSGCSNTSNVINIGYITCVAACAGPAVSLNTSLSCNTITATATATGGTPSWFVSPGYTSVAPAGNTNTIVYPDPGYYGVLFVYIYPTGCTATAYKNVTIPVVAHFHYDWGCGVSGYTLQLHDISALLAGWNNTTTGSVTWNVTGPGGPYTHSGLNFNLPLSPGTYTVTETVVGAPNSGSGVTGTCVVTQTIVVPSLTTIDFTAVPNSICEGVPIAFTPVVTGSPAIGSYSWDFGDGATNLLSNPSRNYTWTTSASHVFTVTLTAINDLGCTYQKTHTVTIFHNDMSGTVTGPSLSCGAPVAIAYNPVTGGVPATYLWSNGPTTASDVITASGAYFVAVENTHQCRYVTDPYNVTILTSTPLAISGRNTYCVGDAVVLSDYVGADNTYQWYIGGVPISGATSPMLIQSGLTPGTYNFTVVVTHTYISTSGTIICSQTSPVYPVTINANPTPPVISGPFVLDCSLYKLQLNASGVAGAVFNWSDGASGPTDIIYHGGGYRVWQTDVNGCRSYADKNVPLSPSSYFGWFPSGCYNFCNTFMGAGGLILYGPPGAFQYWAWLRNSIITTSGYTSGISPLPITTAGNYQLRLDNGLCSATSDFMSVASKPCDTCKKIIGQQPAAVLVCNSPSDPAGYTLTISLQNPFPVATTFTLGMDIGPIVPFTVTVPASSMSTFSLHFTTLPIPPPATCTVWVRYIMPGGQECYDNVVIKVPVCTWLPQKQIDSSGTSTSNNIIVATGLLVYPNPAQNTVNINYNYGETTTADRRIVLYDMMGRKLVNEQVNETNSTLTVQLDNLAAGNYIIRMEEGGKAIHTQQLSVTH